MLAALVYGLPPHTPPFLPCLPLQTLLPPPLPPPPTSFLGPHSPPLPLPAEYNSTPSKLGHRSLSFTRLHVMYDVTSVCILLQDMVSTCATSQEIHVTCNITQRYQYCSVWYPYVNVFQAEVDEKQQGRQGRGRGAKQSSLHTLMQVS